MKKMLSFMIILSVFVSCQTEDEKSIGYDQLKGYWKITSTTDPQNNKIEATSFYIGFNENNALLLLGKYNQGTATYAITDDQLQISNIQYTALDCRSVEYSLEQTLISSLSGRITLNTDTLKISSQNDYQLSLATIDSVWIMSGKGDVGFSQIPFDSLQYYYTYTKSIHADQFYSTDPFYPNFSKVYGKWDLTSAKGGWGGDSYEMSFETLEIIQNAIYICRCGNDVVEYGKITLALNPRYDPVDATKLVITLEPAFLGNWQMVTGLYYQNHYFVDIQSDNELYFYPDGSDMINLTFTRSTTK